MIESLRPLASPHPNPSRKREGLSDGQSAPLPLAGGVGGGPATSETDLIPRGQFKPRNTQRARELRNQATPAERRLWSALSKRQVNGAKFSRQMPVGPYFVDFLSREAMLIIELDGYSHDLQQDYDQRRDQTLIDLGYSVLRFSNDDVMGNLEGVVHAISVALIKSPPVNRVTCLCSPPPASGRGELLPSPPHT